MVVLLLILMLESSLFWPYPFDCHPSGIENSSNFHQLSDENVTNIVKSNIKMHEVEHLNF